MTQNYLKRQEGNDLGSLLKRLHERKINPTIKQKIGCGVYFRETVLHLSADLKELYRNFELLVESVNVKRHFNRTEGYIELEATYNFVVPTNNIEIKPTDEYVEITEEIERALKLDKNPVPRGIPIERILIYQIE